MTAAQHTQADVHLSFTGTLVRHADRRVLPCDATGNNRQAVCMQITIDTPTMGQRPLHVTRFFDDYAQAEAACKQWRKGAVITVHLPACSMRLAGTADFIELQAPAPEPVKPCAKPTPTPPINHTEPELFC